MLINIYLTNIYYLIKVIKFLSIYYTVFIQYLLTTYFVNKSNNYIY